MIDLLVSPDLALGNGDVDRIGVMHGPRPFTDDVKNPSKTEGICLFKKNLADPIPGPDPSAGDHDVFIVYRDACVCEQFLQFLQIGREMTVVHNRIGVQAVGDDDLALGKICSP